MVVFWTVCVHTHTHMCVCVLAEASLTSLQTAPGILILFFLPNLFNSEHFIYMKLCKKRGREARREEGRETERGAGEGEKMN